MQATRRGLILGAGATALGGCATTQAVPPASSVAFTRPLPPAGTRLVLAPVHVAPDRVIRVVAGLRPFRPSGFVVRAEPLGDKRLVHNYGHGGGGITLSWGTSHLAADLGFQGPGRDYAVLGCGAVGLATARLLQRRGGRVTIYARDLPPQTTSNIAGGQWWPSSVFDRSAATDLFQDQFQQAARLSYRHFQDLVGGGYGVRWTRNYEVGRRGGGLFETLGDVAPEERILQPGEHPFGDATVHQFDSMMIEPPRYLQAMMEDVLLAGGKIVVRDFATPAEVAALPEPVVFNCTGLGARQLFGDEELTPIKGQLVVLLPQPEVTYNLLSGAAYMFPRADGVILGGSHERGNWDITPDPAVTARILAQHQALFARMAW